MTRDSIREGLVELALRVERIADFDTQEAVDLNKALHDLLPEPKCVQPPNYLRSIDAAMSLVPEGLYPTLDFVTSRCWLRTAEGYDLIGGVAHGFAATPALALVAAALRAKAQS